MSNPLLTTSLSQGQRVYSDNEVYSAWRCPKHVYLVDHAPELDYRLSDEQEMFFEDENEIIATAIGLYSGGCIKNVGFTDTPEKDATATLKAISAHDSTTILNATFLHEGIYCQVPVIQAFLQ